MVVNGIARVRQLLFDDDRGWALFLLEESAPIASDEIACVVMNEKVIFEANFHSAGGCRNVDGQSAGFFDNLVYGQALGFSRLAGCGRLRYLDDFIRNDDYTCQVKKRLSVRDQLFTILY